MSWGWKIAAGVWSALLATVLMMATVPAKEGISNLASWADLFGLTSVAHLVGTKYADTIVQVLGGAVAVISALFFYFAAEHARRLMAEDETVPNEYDDLQGR
jgi:hypothetical protein